MPTRLTLTVVCDIWPTHPPVSPWQSSVTNYPPISPTHWTSHLTPSQSLVMGYKCMLFMLDIPSFRDHSAGGCFAKLLTLLKHWGRVSKICIGKLTVIGSDNGLLPGQRQVIIWTNAVIWILLIGILETKLMKFYLEFKHFHWRKCIWNCYLQSGGDLVLALLC